MVFAAYFLLLEGWVKTKMVDLLVWVRKSEQRRKGERLLMLKAKISDDFSKVMELNTTK